MEKSDVIKMRTALKGGHNWPLKVMVDNNHTVIDEAGKLEFTKWDDDNEMLYSFRLPDMQTDRFPNNVGQFISVFAIHYDYIQAMEVSAMPISKFGDLFGTLADAGCNMSETFKTKIQGVFTDALKTDRVNLTPTDINYMLDATDPKAVSDKDDWYNGKFTQNFAETRQKALLNKQAEEEAVENESEDDSPIKLAERKGYLNINGDE